MRKLFVLTGIVMGTAVILTLLITNLQAAPTVPFPTTLYDPDLQNTPSDQVFEYAEVGTPLYCEIPPYYFCPMPAIVTKVYSSSIMGTIFDSTYQKPDYAGYAITPTLAPTLKREEGFKLDFTLNIVEEDHSTPDRAGFVVILLADDMKGIEVSFWEDEIWVQEDNDSNSPPLFTHAEGVPYTTTAWIDYELEIISDTYSLSANNTEVLSGTVRDYTAWESPTIPGYTFPDPYETPNLIFFGDNSSQGGSQTWIRDIVINTDVDFAHETYLPIVIK